MHILHAYKIYKPDVNGGIPAVIGKLCEQMMGIKNEIVVSRQRGRGRRYVFDGTPVRATLSFGTLLSMPLSPTYPVELIRRSRLTDVLVHHAPFPLTDIAILLGLPRRCTLIVYWHADIVGRSFLRFLLSPILRYALRRADRIVVSDDSVARGSATLHGFRSKLAVVPYGLDTAYWSILDEDQRREADRRRASQPRLVITVGRLVHYKGYDILLRAMTGVSVEAVIIGDGPERVHLERQAAALGITDRVTFAGGLSDDEIKVWLHAASAFVLPSRTDAEAFGLVQIEAMAAGLTVVNTGLPTAVPTIARDRQEGLTVPPEDPDALAAALQELLDNPQLASKLGTAGRTRALAQFDKTLFLERMSNLYYETFREHSIRCGVASLN